MQHKIPAWLSSAVFYQIYPSSFMDSNGDGIGDINGIIQKLDYIKSLGCNAIWINPCYLSPFNDGGYDVADYYKVAPRYGTNADLKRLFKTASRKGIRVCLDLVAGHTSIEHPWFKESCKPQKNRYSNWYIWTNSVWDWASEKTNTVGYSLQPVLGYARRDGNFFTNFFWFQPALNFGFAEADPQKKWQLPVNHPDVLAVRNEIKKIMRFWLNMGASGFRCDMASSLIKCDANWEDTSRYWREVREMFDREYPDAILIAEWFYPEKAVTAGFHIDFMANGKCNEAEAYTALFRKEKRRSVYGGSGYSFFDKLGRGNIMEFLDVYLKHFNAVTQKGYISLCSGNHDFPRISIGRSRRELEIVFAFLLTMPGVPFIYYGDEIGMRYLNVPSKEGGFHRTGARTPMQWNQSKNAGFSTASKNKLYLPIDPCNKRPTVASQENNPNSLLNRVRCLIAMRRQNRCLCADGQLDFIYAKPHKYPIIFVRSQGNKKMVIALNPSRKKIAIKLDCDCMQFNWVPEMGYGVTAQKVNGKYLLKMNGISYGIFHVSRNMM